MVAGYGAPAAAASPAAAGAGVRHGVLQHRAGARGRGMGPGARGSRGLSHLFIFHKRQCLSSAAKGSSGIGAAAVCRAIGALGPRRAGPAQAGRGLRLSHFFGLACLTQDSLNAPLPSWAPCRGSRALGVGSAGLRGSGFQASGHFGSSFVP
jgi:hypothetical protein